MKSNQKKLEKKNKNNTRNLIIIFFSLFLILFLFFLSLFYFFSDNKNLKEITPIAPREELTVDYDFKADVYFNDKLGENIFSDEVIKSINSATNTIEIAVYAMNDSNIKEALKKAADRGVEIVVLVCSKGKDIHDVFFADIENFITRKDITYSFWKNNRSYLMHHKFIIVDRQLESRTLFFGSYNFTYLQEKYDPSFLIKTNDENFVRIFGEEFDRINSGIHGARKTIENVNPFAARIKYKNGFIEIWFSPGDKYNNAKNRMIELAKNTQEKIRIMIWLWTDRGLAKEILLIPKDKKITMITDESNLNQNGSVFKSIFKVGVYDNVEVITDEKRQYEMQELGQNILNSFLHQHTMIIDDKILITGTNNWSIAGFFNNDESIIISDIPFLVESFVDSFKINYLKNK